MDARRVKRFAPFAVALLAIIALVVILTSPAFLPAPIPPDKALLTASEGLDIADIELTLSESGETLRVRQTLTLTNREGDALDSLVLRAYANAFASEDYSPAATEELHARCYPNGFSPGGVTIISLAADEKPVAYAFSDAAKTVLRVTPQGGLSQGERLTLRAEYEVAIPNARHRFGRSGGIIALGNALMLPSVRIGGEWREDEYLSIGDPFISRCMNFSVTLTLPEGYRAAASAYAVPEAINGGGLRYRFEGLAMRDFALSVSRDYSFAYQKASGAVIIGAAETTGAANELAKYGARAIEAYSALYGAYPYPSFTLAQVDFPFGGMEYPGYAMLSSELCLSGGQALEQVASHEAAHQWWYAVVGSDPYYDAWQDEGLAEFAMLDYWERYYGSRARDDLRRVTIDTAMRVLVPRGVTPGSPVSYFGELSEYSTVVYRRGAALMEALRLADSEGFYRFLRAYYERYAFQIATRGDFERLLTEYMSMDVQPLIIDYLDTYITN